MTTAMAILLALALQGSTEERGAYKLTYAGKEAGRETFRLETFEDGKIVLFSKADFELKIRDKKVKFKADTVLTMGGKYEPRLYSAFHEAGGVPRQVKMTWEKGAVDLNGKKVKTTAPFLLDNNVYAQFLPLLRRHEGKRSKTSVFSPVTGGDIKVVVEDKGEVELRKGDKGMRAREYLILLGPQGITAHVDEKKRMIRIESPASGGLAELEGFEGFARAPRRGPLKLPRGVVEEKVKFPSGNLTLAGTVTRPKEGSKFPAVVLVSGSGAQDRDGNLPGHKIKWNILKEAAYALSRVGLLVLRYDDRGSGESGGDFAKAKLSDFVADVEAAVSYVRECQDTGAVGIVGHSEGGVIAPMVAARDPKIRAVFLMAATAKPLDAVILAQMERRLKEQGVDAEAAKGIVAKQRAVFDRIKASKEDMIEIDGRPTFVGWLREHFLHDPCAELAKVKGKVVIFQGMKDGQVFPPHAELLHKARPDAEVKRFENLDHLFMRSGGSVGEYFDPDRRVDADFLKALAESAAKHLAGE